MRQLIALPDEQIAGLPPDLRERVMHFKHQYGR